MKCLPRRCFDGGITNPTLPSVEPFLTVDYKSTGTLGRLNMLATPLFDGGITNPTLNKGRTFFDGGLQIHRNPWALEYACHAIVCWWDYKSHTANGRTFLDGGLQIHRNHSAIVHRIVGAF